MSDEPSPGPAPRGETVWRPDPPAPDQWRERRRQIILTIGVVAAIAGVWAVALGILDTQSPIVDPNRYGGSIRNRVERRPVLFVVAAPQDEPAATSATTVTAVAIAVVEPGVVVRSPISHAGSADDQTRELRAFSDTYFAASETVELLRGGALAGSMRFAGDARTGDSLPVARLMSVVPGQSPGIEREEVLLAVTDRRIGASSSGVRPMRESHRAEVDQLARRIFRDRFPGTQIDGDLTMRVRVADLNRDGQPEILATVSARLHAEAKPVERANLFVIAESIADGTSDPSVRSTFVMTSVAPDPVEPDLVTFVDQVDLSPDVYDEVVLRIASDDSAEYLVLQRRGPEWFEVFASDRVRL